jgi:hypothetical protein
MTKREFTGKGGETWEWEETPEVVAAIKKLHESSKAVEAVNSKPKFKGNYQGPLYAPHPDLKRPKRIVTPNVVITENDESN